ncbi:MAG: hypothetical protein U0169_11800 [Polyangiaceae bacterium]
MLAVLALVFALPGVTRAEATPPFPASSSTPTSSPTSAPSAGVDVHALLTALHTSDAKSRADALDGLLRSDSRDVDALVREHTLQKKSVDAEAITWVKTRAAIAVDDMPSDALPRSLVTSFVPTRGHEAALDLAAIQSALAGTKSPAGARAFVRVAADAPAVFRPFLSRQLHALGDVAVPGLVREAHHPNSAIRAWATSELEALGKKSASDAVQLKEPARVAEVLRAYGDTRDIDAIGVIAAFINTDRGEVRDAARAAMRSLGPLATTKARETLANLTNQPAPTALSPDALFDELFRACDRARFHEVYALLDEGLALARGGKNTAAVAVFDRVLARTPGIDRRAEMVPVYVASATELEESDRKAARANFEKVLHLDPTTERRREVESALAYLEGLDIAESGASSAPSFERALELDPGNARAKGRLEALRSDATARTTQLRQTTWLVSIGAALVVLASLAVALRRPRTSR